VGTGQERAPSHHRSLPRAQKSCNPWDLQPKPHVTTLVVKVPGPTAAAHCLPLCCLQIPTKAQSNWRSFSLACYVSVWMEQKDSSQLVPNNSRLDPSPHTHPSPLGQTGTNVCEFLSFSFLLCFMLPVQHTGAEQVVTGSKQKSGSTDVWLGTQSKQGSLCPGLH
jgi:hypothetical protein